MGFERCELCTGNIAAGERVAIQRGVEGEICAQVADAYHGCVERHDRPGIIVTDCPQPAGAAMRGKITHSIEQYLIGRVDLRKHVHHNGRCINRGAAREDIFTLRFPMRAGGCDNC